MQFADIATGAGSFFKTVDNMDAVAILVDVKRLEPQRPGKFGPKDAIHADVHIFKDAASLEAGTPEVLQGAIINQAPLVRDLANIVGQATVVKLEMTFFKNLGKDVAVFRQVDAATKQKVIAYAMALQEAVAAEMDDAPDF